MKTISKDEVMPVFSPGSYSEFDVEEHSQKRTSEESSLQWRHKATISTFPFDLPFEFQVKPPRSKENSGHDEAEAEQVSPSIYSDRRPLTDSHDCEYEHEYEHLPQHHYQLQPRRFSPTPSFTSSHHNLHECPFYTNEISNLKLQVIELGYNNATLEHKVRRYREEVRLFKQDIKGYKLDGRQFAELVMEKENEIETLHRKIAQILNQDCLPLPPRSTPNPINSGNHKRHGRMADLSVRWRDYAHIETAQRGPNHGTEKVG